MLTTVVIQAGADGMGVSQLTARIVVMGGKNERAKGDKRGEGGGLMMHEDMFICLLGVSP